MDQRLKTWDSGAARGKVGKTLQDIDIVDNFLDQIPKAQEISLKN